MISSVTFPLGIASGVSVSLQSVIELAKHAVGLSNAHNGYDDREDLAEGFVNWEQRLHDHFRILPDQYVTATEQLVTCYGIAHRKSVDIERARKFIGGLQTFHEPNQRSLAEKILGAIRQVDWKP